MEKSGQLSAPGSLEAGTAVVPEAPRLPAQPLGELAAEHGLKLSGARPSLPGYVASLWQRRHFIWGYATARSVSMYTAGGFSDSSLMPHSGTFAGSVVIMYITPQK